MKITRVKTEKLKLELLKPIKVALGTIEHSETMLVKIETDEGLVGFGEGSPIEFVTGETIDTALSVTKLLGEEILGYDPVTIGKLHHVMDRTIQGNPSAKAAIDMAIYDICSKKMGVPLYKMLGGYRDCFETDITILIDKPEQMAKEAAALVGKGFKILKIKVGLEAQEDIERIKEIRKAVGSEIKIRVDANQGWNVAEAIMVINEMEKYKLDAVEQPVASWNRQGLAEIKKKVHVPIMADESVFTPQDALELVGNKAIDFLNIKLMKCGGIYKANMINTIGETAGVECMLGCMLESNIALTAAASFIAANRNVTRADIDSTMHIKENNIKGGIRIENGVVYLPEIPGLGVEVDM